MRKRTAAAVADTAKSEAPLASACALVSTEDGETTETLLRFCYGLARDPWCWTVSKAISSPTADRTRYRGRAKLKMRSIIDYKNYARMMRRDAVFGSVDAAV